MSRARCWFGADCPLRIADAANTRRHACFMAGIIGRDILRSMRFAPEYVTYVLNENFEDAKALLLAPMMAINYAHLVMLAAQAIVPRDDARRIRVALDGISQDDIRRVKYDGTYEDLFFYVEQLIVDVCG